MPRKVVISCALTGVLTDPKTHPVPVTPKEMGQAAKEAQNAGASIVHVHFRSQAPGQGHLPTWDPHIAQEICSEIRNQAPHVRLNLSTGVMGPDISGPLACLRAVKPEMAALNCGSLNYLKVKENGQWTWPPLLFDNPVEKIQGFLSVMKELQIQPECECFDTGIVRSIGLFKKVGLLKEPLQVSFVMGVASGMPADPDWLPLLIKEISDPWQVIAIGREEVWSLHREALRLGGNIRTGLEDTFYLPDGRKARSNGELVEAAARLVREMGLEVAQESSP